MWLKFVPLKSRSVLRAESILLEQCVRLIIFMQQNSRNQFQRALDSIHNLQLELRIWFPRLILRVWSDTWKLSLDSVILSSFSLFWSYIYLLLKYSGEVNNQINIFIHIKGSIMVKRKYVMTGKAVIPISKRKVKILKR